MIEVNKFVVSMMSTNCFIIIDKDSKECAVVDPGEITRDLKSKIIELKKENYKFKYILLTHGHFDHIAGTQEMKEITGAKVVICKKEEEFINNNSLNLSHMFIQGGLKKINIDIFVKENDDILSLGDNKIDVIETPGHTIGGCCYIIQDMMFVGDTVMRDTVGRTDFPTGSYSDIIKSVEKIKRYSKNYKLYCGHGYETTLNREKASNEYFRISI